MGAVSSTLEAVSDVASGVGDIASGAIDGVSQVGSNVDDFVNDQIPGGWATVAAITAATAGVPGLTGSETTGGGLLSGAGEGAFPGLAEGTVASDVGVQTLSPGLAATVTETPVLPPPNAPVTDTGGLLSGQGEGAFPGLSEGTVASDSGMQAVSIPATVGGTTDTGIFAGQGEGAFPGATPGTVASDTGGILSGATQGGIGQNLGQRFLGNQLMATLLQPDVLGGLLTSAGGLIGGQQNLEARREFANQIRAAGREGASQAAFRPVGITTRFGASQFQIDPTTGQLVSAGYGVSPEVKALQDRLMALTGNQLTQAELAGAEYAPLTGAAQGLFGLSSQYLGQSPQDVAQRFVSQRQALLQPERERQLATIRNRLQRTGRGGLSVAQGGDLAAANPELAAYYNALAQQDARLAAEAEQEARNQITFGTGLLGDASRALGLRYAGQQAALTPFTQYLTGVSDIETLGQQPFSLATNLGQLTSAAGARSGELGLRGSIGAGQIMTAPEFSTFNPLANIFGGLGRSPLGTGLISQGLNSLFGTGLGSGFGSINPVSGEFLGSLEF